MRGVIRNNQTEVIKEKIINKPQGRRKMLWPRLN
jgi:hypothetical protein